MSDNPSSCSIAPLWLLNYIYVIGITSPLGGVVACAFGASVPPLAFVGLVWLALATLQCASGKHLLRDVATVVRAWRRDEIQEHA